MVQRWEFSDWSHAGDGAGMDPTPEGKYIEYKDYQSLQAALREALDGWDDWSDTGYSGGEEAKKRIAELKKQFLDI